jgi:hypothetical protein
MTETIVFDPAALPLGHDGLCDHDGGCGKPATMIMLSAAAPGCECGGCDRDAQPQASLALVCDAHLPAEPVASREAAEAQARIRDDGQGAWRRLIEVYPEPLRIERETP